MTDRVPDGPGYGAGNEARTAAEHERNAGCSGERMSQRRGVGERMMGKRGTISPVE